MTVRSVSGDPAGCVVDGEDLARGFVFMSGESTDAVLKGITVRRALGRQGTAIYIKDSSPTIRGCIVEDCDFRHGSALFAENSSVVVDGCTFQRNLRGAVYLRDCGDVTPPRIENCLFKDNVGYRIVTLWYSSADVIGSAFFGNVSDRGCLDAVLGRGTVRGCTLAFTTVNFLGSGVISFHGGELSVSETIVAFNEAPAAIDCYQVESEFRCLDVYGGSGLGVLPTCKVNFQGRGRSSRESVGASEGTRG